MTAKREFARRLDRMMKERGWSNADTARAAWGTTIDSRGYTVAKNRDRITSYLSGKVLPDRKNLEALASGLGLAAEELMPTNAAVQAGSERKGLSITTTAQGSAAHLQIDQLVPMSVALKIAEILHTARSDSGEGRSND